jgi:hypothetical protein
MRDGNVANNAREMTSRLEQLVRQQLLNTLVELSAICPETRFGQLIANLSTLARGLSPEGLWDAEDEELLAAARQELAYFAEHRPIDPESTLQPKTSRSAV